MAHNHKDEPKPAALTPRQLATLAALANFAKSNRRYRPKGPPSRATAGTSMKTDGPTAGRME
jgi:hypothetical protein